MRGFFFLLLPLLAACGNANDGRKFTPHPAAATAATTPNPVSVTPTSTNTAMLACRTALVLSDDANFTATYSATRLCPMQGTTVGVQGNVARVMTGVSVPSNTRLCLVPFVNGVAASETCFAITNQADVLVSTSLYNSAVIVPEASLAAYKAYTAMTSNVAPSRALFSL